MATLNVQSGTLEGFEPVFGAADAGLADEFPNNGREVLLIKNGGGSPVIVTVDDSLSVAPPGSESFDPDAVVTVSPGGEGILGRFPTGRFGATAQIAYDQVASVTVAVVAID